MDTIEGVIEGAEIHKIGDLFNRKPRGLKINETDALVVTARTADGRRVSRTFYFCLKPDGTFDEESLSGDGSRARRRRLGTFLRYYGLTEKSDGYAIKSRVREWKGRPVEVLKDGDVIYVP